MATLSHLRRGLAACGRALHQTYPGPLQCLARAFQADDHAIGAIRKACEAQATPVH